MLRQENETPLAPVLRSERSKAFSNVETERLRCGGRSRCSRFRSIPN